MVVPFEFELFKKRFATIFCLFRPLVWCFKRYPSFCYICGMLGFQAYSGSQDLYDEESQATDWDAVFSRLRAIDQQKQN